jgi:acyl carrier protein
MNEEQVFNRIVNILEPFVGDPGVLRHVTRQTHIIDDLKVNSARLVDIIIQAEDTFDIVIEDDEADEVGTLEDMVRLIARKIAKRSMQ